MEKEQITGFKGFDKDFKCRDMQYKENETFEIEGDPKVCEKGLHLCEYPLDVFGYYPPGTSRFAEVKGEGKAHKQNGGDSKVAVSKIHIGAELNLKKFIDAAIKFTFDRIVKTKEKVNKEEKMAASNSGDYGAASNSGTRGAASNSGYQGAASNSGTRGAASNSGYQGAAVALGIEAKAKSTKGGWITIAEWKQDKNGDWQRVNVKSIKVDGKKIKEDTFYILKGGKFVKAKG